MITLRQIIKNKGLTNKLVTDALGVASTNIMRYDDLSKRSFGEIQIIASAIGESVSNLIRMNMGIEIEDSINTITSVSQETEAPPPITNERLLSIIESQQRTIENLSNSLQRQ